MNGATDKWTRVFFLQAASLHLEFAQQAKQVQELTRKLNAIGTATSCAYGSFSATNMFYDCQMTVRMALLGYLHCCSHHISTDTDLMKLLHMAAEIEPAFLSWEDCVFRLAPHATRDDKRFDELTSEDVEEGLDDAGRIYQQVLSFLPDELHPH